MSAIDDIDKAKEALGAAMASLLMRGESETAARCARAALNLSCAQDLINRLELLCSSCYAGLGAEFNLPERFLDALSDPLNATDAQIEALLPVSRDEGTDKTGYFEPTTTTPPPEPVPLEERHLSQAERDVLAVLHSPMWSEMNAHAGMPYGPIDQHPRVPMDVPISQIKFGEYRQSDFVREGSVWQACIDGKVSKIYFMKQLDKENK